jgi:hypothetical protein
LCIVARSLYTGEHRKKFGVLQTCVMNSAMCEVVTMLTHPIMYKWLAMYVLPPGHTGVLGERICFAVYLAAHSGVATWAFAPSWILFRVLKTAKPLQQFRGKAYTYWPWALPLFILFLACICQVRQANISHIGFGIVLYMVGIINWIVLMAVLVLGIYVAAKTMDQYNYSRVHAKSQRTLTTPSNVSIGTFFLLFPLMFFISYGPYQLNVVFGVQQELLWPTALFFCYGAWSGLVFAYKEMRASSAQQKKPAPRSATPKEASQKSISKNFVSKKSIFVSQKSIKVAPADGGKIAQTAGALQHDSTPDQRCFE